MSAVCSDVDKVNQTGNLLVRRYQAVITSHGNHLGICFTVHSLYLISLLCTKH